ncbi:MAG TPA: ATP-dependent metalloprotease, partial [Candidatus Competibacteraceae bacterium]|nr:ATP-dependent metalloprotease [Candidatus Competibacteraceae bacterium]
SEDDGEVFLGRSVTRHKNVSDETAHVIDEEIRSIIDRNYRRSEELLRANLDKLHTMADALIKFETIDSEQIDDIMAGRAPREPAEVGGDGEPPSSGVDLGKDKERTGDGKIGGPAPLH